MKCYNLFLNAGFQGTLDIISIFTLKYVFREIIDNPFNISVLVRCVSSCVRSAYWKSAVFAFQCEKVASYQDFVWWYVHHSCVCILYKWGTVVGVGGLTQIMLIWFLFVLHSSAKNNKTTNKILEWKLSLIQYIYLSSSICLWTVLGLVVRHNN